MTACKIALSLMLTAGCITTAFAGEDVLSAADIKRQAIVLKNLQRAAKAARANNRTVAKTALREAAHAGGYNLEYSPAAGGCGQSAFRMPAWLLFQQARIGDGEGAREAARNLGNAEWSASALIEIACLQAGVRPHMDPRPWSSGVRAFSEMKPRDLTFTEAVSNTTRVGNFSIGNITYRNHDFAALARLNVAPNRQEAWKTLRQALPYASVPLPPMPEPISPSRWPGEDVSRAEPGLLKLAGFQAYLGDTEGLLQTVARMRRPQSKAYALAYAATIFRQSGQKSPAAAVESRAEKMVALLKTPELQAATRYYLTRLYLMGHDFREFRYARMSESEPTSKNASSEENRKQARFHAAATERHIAEMSDPGQRNQCLLLLQRLRQNKL